MRLVDNPRFRLRPGTTLRYRGEQDGLPGAEVFRVTRRSRTILGVRTTIVPDHVFERGRRAGRRAARHLYAAHPAVGRSFRQEFLKGRAEDHFGIVGVHATLSVPGARSRRALETREWSPLEPGVRDQKLYARGIGTVLERTLGGGDERRQLVSIEPQRGVRIHEPSARPY